MSDGSASFQCAALRLLVLGVGAGTLATGPACERQTFDLLSTAGSPANTASQAGVSAGGAEAGVELDAGAGRSGSGGEASSQPGGTGGGGVQEPCLSGEQCTDGGLNCPASVPFCRRCQKSQDCTSDAPFCDEEDGRCAECRVHGADCGENQICHPLTLRCEQACAKPEDCAAAHNRPMCDPFGACVTCSNNDDCRNLYGHIDGACFFGACVECYVDKQCSVERPFCVGLRCQSKR